MPCLTEGWGLGCGKQRVRWERRLPRPPRTRVGFGLHCKSGGGGPWEVCSLTSRVCPLAHSAPAKPTLTSGPLHLQCLLPDILPRDSEDVLPALVQDTTEVPSPKTAYHSHHSHPCPRTLRSLAWLYVPSGPRPFPDALCLSSASQTSTSTP